MHNDGIIERNDDRKNGDGSLDVNLEFNGDFKDSITVCFGSMNRCENSRMDTPCGSTLYDTYTLQMDFMREKTIRVPEKLRRESLPVYKLYRIDDSAVSESRSSLL